jgi:hypothetical protein
MWHYGLTQRQHYNNDNDYNDDDSMMHANVWYEYLGGLYISMSTPMIYMEKTWWQENEIQTKNIPKVPGYKKRSDIEEVDSTEFKVYTCPPLHETFLRVSTDCCGCNLTYTRSGHARATNAIIEKVQSSLWTLLTHCNKMQADFDSSWEIGTLE